MTLIDDDVTYKNEKIDSVISSHITDCCYNMQLSDDFIIQTIIDNFIKLRRKSCFEKCSNENLSAYMIYNTLKIMKIPRSLKYIASWCGVTTNDIWTCESVDDSISRPTGVWETMLKIYSQLGLTLPEAKDVYKLRKELPDLNKKSFSPHTLSGALLYSYCKKNKKKITLNQVSDLVHVSNVDIHRCIKYFRNKQ